ncbi:MAG: GtrA family protein, partial [Planctomycetaceae bacterium]|nr:GtrA family protein [Planctomycetaceae bacterium]
PWFRQYLAFCISCLLGGTLNWLTRVGLVTGTTYFARHQLAAAALGVLAGMIFNFLLCRFFVFAKPEQVFGPRLPRLSRPEYSNLVGVTELGDQSAP